MTNKFKLIAAALLLVTGSFGSAVGSMKCGTHIISWGQGDSPGQYEVYKRCGPPTYKQGNTWVYEKSSSVSVKIRFDDQGNIVQID